MDGVRSEELRFTSGQRECAATWYRPVNARGPLPCVVMGHGLGLVRTAGLPAYAELFARQGLSALLFDYGHFGDSAGEPRRLLDIGRQRADWHAAIGLARGLGGVDADRVALWGTSFGGGHAIEVAARDERIAAVVVQCPFTDGLASSTRLGMRSSARVVLAALADQVAAATGRPPIRIPAAGPRGSAALMTASDAAPGYETLRRTGPPFEITVPARVALRIPFSRPVRAAAKVRCPLLVCVCVKDSVAPPGPSRRAARSAPRGELREYPVGHFEIYHGEWFERATAEQTAFLRHHLLPG